MPTTREPILDTPVFRAKLPSPSKAQVEAYQTYERKVQQVRERNNSEGVRVPSKIVSNWKPMDVRQIVHHNSHLSGPPQSVHHYRSTYAHVANNQFKSEPGSTLQDQ
ncbi:hypothetical protein K458DRAFT_388785 [Lentithecium fluviatile CBS 122367]|uniref:Uncharacterized protein n=1 Tax=Lentithecium fluviatile CBS 122367 TaxID=1168545 RepID=A0A6G1J1P1_9PLEO|nr:hypothetical protein K458DRAFT_388785 [Lentithecium fluviatile CBS 122367]